MSNPYEDLLEREKKNARNNNNNDSNDSKEYLAWLPRDFFPSNKSKKMRLVGPWVPGFIHDNLFIWKRKFENGKFVGIVKERMSGIPCLSQDSAGLDPDNCPFCKLHAILMSKPEVAKSENKPRRTDAKTYLVYDKTADEGKRWYRWNSKAAVHKLVISMLTDLIDEESGDVMREANFDFISFESGYPVIVTKTTGAKYTDTKYSAEAITKPDPIPASEKEEYEKWLGQLRKLAMPRNTYDEAYTLAFESDEAKVIADMQWNKYIKTDAEETDDSIDSENLPF